MSIPGAFTSAALMVGVLATLVLGVYPAPVLDLAEQRVAVRPVTRRPRRRGQRGRGAGVRARAVWHR